MPDISPLLPEDPARLGPYTLIGRLGRGGYGVVYLAETATAERVAVKLLQTHLAEEGGEHSRFAREAAAAKRVARFCTAQVLDADIAGDRPYIVSEYIAGPSLQGLVTGQGPLEGGPLDRLAIGMATALVAIHQAGVVHRDLKPPNVLVGPDGPRVIDFGIARMVDRAPTVTGHALGTPAYMAPEQVSGEEITSAADVFAWGATVVFAANGTPPFGRDSLAVLAHRIMNEPPELGVLSGRLRALVAECLDKDPDRRPSASVLLMRLLGHETVPGTEHARTAILAEGVTAAIPATIPARVPAATVPATHRPAGAGDRKWVLALAGLAGALVLAGGVIAGLPALRHPRGLRPLATPTSTIYTTQTTHEPTTAPKQTRSSSRPGPAPQPMLYVRPASCDLGVTDTTCTATLRGAGAAFDWTGTGTGPLSLSASSGHLDPGGTDTVTITLHPETPRAAGSGTVTFTGAGGGHTVRVSWQAEPAPEPSGT
jgi:predicted Ser/Thr protein kinase